MGRWSQSGTPSLAVPTGNTPDQSRNFVANGGSDLYHTHSRLQQRNTLIERQRFVGDKFGLLPRHGFEVTVDEALQPVLDRGEQASQDQCGDHDGPV